MQRRDFIKNTLASAATLTVATKASSLAVFGSAANAQDNLDYSLGWESVVQDSLANLDMDISGTIPAELTGNYFRNGPAKMERAGVRYHHWFDGDGMIQKFKIGNNGIQHSAQFVHTRKYIEEEKAQQFLYTGAGTVIENGRPVRNNDTGNTANTALQVWDDELLALWEGGSAYSLNPETLATNGIKTWHEDLVGMPFSAHPVIDHKGFMWNFGAAPYAGKNGKIFIYKIAPKTGLKTVKMIDMPFKGYMHDFAQTEQSLVFFIPPYTHTKHGAKTFVDSFEWKPDAGSKILVVDKNDLSQHKWFDLPAGFVFHFGHASEERGLLQVNMCWYDSPSLMQQGMKDLMINGNQNESSHALATTFIANLKTGKSNLVKSNVALEFPMFASGLNRANDIIFGVSKSDNTRSRDNRLTAFNPYDGVQDYFDYNDGILIEEPYLVESNIQKEAHIFQTFLDVKNGQSGINIFKANNLKQGPIAQATMKRTIPLGFHGTFQKA